MNESRFAIRTIRDGRIRLYGRDWAPKDPRDGSRPYKGELDGRRMAFGRYNKHTEEGGYEDFVFLWGTEHAYFCDARDEECDNPECWPGPHCIDGTFHWLWWEPIDNR